MEIPSVPHSKFTDGNGDISSAWRQFMTLLVNQLQSGVSDSGYIIPHQDQDTIAQLNTDDTKGGILYDKEGEFAQVNTNGVFKNVGTYEELSTDDINAIPSGKRNGRLLLDTDTGDLKIGMNDEIKTITVT